MDWKTFGLKLAVSVIVLVCVSSLAVVTPALSSFTDEPKAHAMYDRMLGVLRDAQAVYYESEYRWEARGDTLGMCTYKLWMKKPNYARVESRAKMSDAEGILVGDGEYFWIYWPTGRPYIPGEDADEWTRTKLTSYRRTRTPVGVHSIAHDVGRLGTGMTMTIIEPSVFHGYDDPMAPYLDGVKSLGTEVVNGEECDVIEASFMDNQRSRYFWLSRLNGLPLKSKETIRVDFDINTYESWSNIQVDCEIPPEKFVWKPDPSWVEYQPQTLEERLLERGAEAPDFSLKSASGARIRLSDYRGKTVWLIFWRVGCQGCREGLINARVMLKKYRKQGFAVIGFNCADKRNIALAYLRKISVNFPNVVDASAEAQKVFYEGYQKPGMSAVPLSYFIDSQGKVLNAWYGIGEDDEHVLELLRQTVRE